MNTKQAIETRRAVKHYDANHRMTPEEVNELLSLAILAPTAFNIQNWRFVVVTDAELRKQIRATAWDQAQVTDASLLIVLCADLKTWEKRPDRYWVNAPKEVQEFLIPAIGEYVIPYLLGGPESLLIGRVLFDEFFVNRDWPLASAVAIILLLLLVVPIVLLQRYQARDQESAA